MPDQIASFESAGEMYLILACEGDTRGDFGTGLGDVITLGALRAAGRLERGIGPTGWESLEVSAFDGDDDCDGMMEHPRPMGRRTALILKAADLSVVKECDVDLEWQRRDLVGWAGRAFKRGGEPEGVAVWDSPSGPVAFVGLERASAIVAIDLTTREVIGYLDAAADGDVSPEGMCLIPAALSPTGETLLVVAFEVSGTLGVYRVVESAHR